MTRRSRNDHHGGTEDTEKDVQFLTYKQDASESLVVQPALRVLRASVVNSQCDARQPSNPGITSPSRTSVIGLPTLAWYSVFGSIPTLLKKDAARSSGV